MWAVDADRARVPRVVSTRSGSVGMSGPTILGFETSCDETAIGVVRDGQVLSNVLSSQVDEHARFGGVVPEVAARAHVEAIRSLTHRALRDAGVHQMDLDAVAATQGPGLAGALMVGFSYGKALAWALGKPFLGIDHMEGHLFAPILEHEDFAPPGGRAARLGGPQPDRAPRRLGRLRDARGHDRRCRRRGVRQAGPVPRSRIPRRAGDRSRGGRGGDPAAIAFPRALPDRPTDFSFSGLKTAVVTYRAPAPSGR